EPGEPPVDGIEGTQFVEQLLDRPIPAIVGHMSLNLLAEHVGGAARTKGPGQRRCITLAEDSLKKTWCPQDPPAVEQSLEPCAVDGEVVDIERGRDCPAG